MIRRHGIAALCAAAAAFTGPAGQAVAAGQAAIAAQSPSVSQAVAVERAASPAQELRMFVGETTIIPRPRAKQVLVGRGQVVSAAVLENHDVLLVANAPGETSLHIVTDNGGRERWMVRVVPQDMARIGAEIRSFLGTMPKVTSRIIGDKVIVDGDGLDEEALFKLDELAKRYPQVVNLAAFQKDRPWEKMIFMDVKVLELVRSRAKDLGIRWQTVIPGPQAGLVGDIASNSLYRPAPSASGAAIDNAKDFPKQIPAFKGYFGITTAISSQLSLLESRGDAVVLADPQLTARSGKRASFLAGGEIPYQAINQDGSAQITFKRFGVELEIEPVALSSGAIHSFVRAKVSAPDATLNPLAGVPGLRSREAETWFNVHSGETMVIAGLLQREKASSQDALPGLGHVPLVGGLFGGKRRDDRATELMIFVTPRIVETDDAALGQARKDLSDNVNRALSGAGTRK